MDLMVFFEMSLLMPVWQIKSRFNGLVCIPCKFPKWFLNQLAANH